ncbi:MAG: META domain-containing protein, partial [Achromobacter xylosoxidans]|nr:META domain-containing protein [Achromobacter xylosoxidans]
MSTSSATPAANAVSLLAYYWRLVSATDASGKSIPALQKGVEQPLRLSFTADALNVRGGCNAQFGGYAYKNG